jgi:hypothetical protein
MELSIIRRETTGAAPNQYNESETLVRFEVWTLLLLMKKGEQWLTLDTDNGWITVARRDHSHPIVLGWVRLDAYLPRCQQEVLDEILPQLGADR